MNPSVQRPSRELLVQKSMKVLISKTHRGTDVIQKLKLNTIHVLCCFTDSGHLQGLYHFIFTPVWHLGLVHFAKVMYAALLFSSTAFAWVCLQGLTCKSQLIPMQHHPFLFATVLLLKQLNIYKSENCSAGGLEPMTSGLNIHRHIDTFHSPIVINCWMKLSEWLLS